MKGDNSVKNFLSRKFVCNLSLNCLIFLLSSLKTKQMLGISQYPRENPDDDDVDNRARWNWFKKIKLLKIKTGHMYSYVKLNFKASLFSSIFWFEAIFCCKTALLVFWPYSWENGTKRAQKMEFSKIGSKSTQKW